MTPKALATTTKIDKLDLTLKSLVPWGNWVAQSVKHPTSAQVMILRFMSSSLGLGSVLTAQRLEPASDSVSPSLSAPPLLALSLPLSLSVFLFAPSLGIQPSFCEEAQAT